MKGLKRILLGAALALVAVTFSTGCASWSSHEAARIDIPAAHTPVTHVSDRNNPVEIIQFARTLSIGGRHRDAAGIYLDAASRFQSVNGKFEADCKKEAVREYWLAGDQDSARQLLADLEAQQDVYGRAAEEKSLRRLRAMLNGGQVANKK